MIRKWSPIALILGLILPACGGGGGVLDSSPASDVSHDESLEDPGTTADFGHEDVAAIDITKDHGNADEDPSKPTDADTTEEEILCEPRCENKECGEDGCGGSCGTCTENQECQSSKCVCIAGSVSCGETCCASEDVCVEQQCCAPNCVSKDCGDDSCGGSCGTCSEHYTCEVDTCVYVPYCGDGNCDTLLGENCDTCIDDCACVNPEVCYLVPIRKSPNRAIPWSIAARVWPREGVERGC